MKLQNLIHILMGIVCIGLLPRAQAVSPPPPGGYPNFTTAAGDHALQALTSGLGNTAIGTFSLFSVTTGSFNTALGAAALDLNTADSNTATGAAALLFNTTGTENTANGTAALEFNDIGDNNTASGAFALFNNTAGSSNVAAGHQALHNNTTGSANTAIGLQALYFNTGFSGSFNTAIGFSAGAALTTGSGNVCIGSGVSGDAGVSDRTWIRNVYSDVATTRVVYIDSDGHLGTLSSSRRYKEEIRPMDTASEALFTLKPVTFRYKKDVDPSQALSFGLIAEEVAAVNPALITRDEQGKPQTVRYEAVNAMLLNEFLKEHHKNEKQESKIEQQEAKIARQQKQIEALTAGLQKVSAQLEASKPAPQVVNNP